MDEKIKTTIHKIQLLAQQNTEFCQEMQKLFGKTVSAFVQSNYDERITQIYEYCIEKIIRKQAEEFYQDFPVKSIISNLVDDFVRMEFFRRKDNFGDFCLSLYQQIECMTNKLCEDAILTEITSKMWGCPAYIKVDLGANPVISKRSSGDYNIASLVFPGKNKKTGIAYSIEKSKTTLQALYANDKVRTIVYFLGYKAMMKGSDYDSYVEITSLLNDVYQCRNMNHRGNTQNPWETAILDRIIPMKSFYYFKFLGILAQYVDFIKSGFKFIPDMKKYCDSIGKQKVEMPGLKILGKIELPKDSRKRK